VNLSQNHNFLITPALSALEYRQNSSMDFASNMPFVNVQNTSAHLQTEALNFDEICSFSRINYITAFSVLSHQNAELSSCTFVVVPGCIRTADQNIALTIAFTGKTQYKQMAYGTDTSCFQPYFI